MTEKRFQRIGIILKPQSDIVNDTATRLSSFLESRGCEMIYDLGDYDESEKLKARSSMAQSCDVVIVVGGDGTFLDAARSVASTNVPLIGINFGRLGFLVDVSPDDLEQHLSEMLDGRFDAEQRFLLDCQIIRDGETIYSEIALNDVVIHIRDVARMMEFETRINGRFLNHQRADGLIVSTPTGSTAYALSSGGPILHPSIEAVTLVPISPHTLSHRPIVVDARSEIDIIIHDAKQARAQITCDGQNYRDTEVGDLIRIRRHPDSITLLHPEGHDHFHTLRAKLHWSEHP